MPRYDNGIKHSKIVRVYTYEDSFTPRIGVVYKTAEEGEKEQSFYNEEIAKFLNDAIEKEEISEWIVEGIIQDTKKRGKKFICMEKSRYSISQEEKDNELLIAAEKGDSDRVKATELGANATSDCGHTLAANRGHLKVNEVPILLLWTPLEKGKTLLPDYVQIAINHRVKNKETRPMTLFINGPGFFEGQIDELRKLLAPHDISVEDLHDPKYDAYWEEIDQGWEIDNKNISIKKYFKSDMYEKHDKDKIYSGDEVDASRMIAMHFVLKNQEENRKSLGVIYSDFDVLKQFKNPIGNVEKPKYGISVGCVSHRGEPENIDLIAINDLKITRKILDKCKVGLLTHRGILENPKIYDILVLRVKYPIIADMVRKSLDQCRTGLYKVKYPTIDESIIQKVLDKCKTEPITNRSMREYTDLDFTLWQYSLEHSYKNPIDVLYDTNSDIFKEMTLENFCSCYHAIATTIKSLSPYLQSNNDYGTTFMFKSSFMDGSYFVYDRKLNRESDNSWSRFPTIKPIPQESESSTLENVVIDKKVGCMECNIM